MRLVSGVTIPDELWDVADGGDVVYFCGAGISIDPPSDLPTFAQMAAEIAKPHFVAADRSDELADRRDYDVILGELDVKQPNGAAGLVDVHRRIQSMIAKESSHPNRNHKAIALLSRASMTPRIVTTNYDRHLSAALASQGADIDEFAAPALPQGDDFSGLVYLHGHVRQEPRRLVATDVDFGEAYLTRAWAARFVHELFSSATVVFIGYSHDDVVMNYLAKGMGSKGRTRYAFTQESKEEDRLREARKWERLGITPIHYPVIDGLHRTLTETLEEWAGKASWSVIERAEKVRGIVDSVQWTSAAAGLQAWLPGEDEDYLRKALCDPNLAAVFADRAQGPEWLRWAGHVDAFRRALTDSPDAADEALIRWFAAEAVRDVGACSAALDLVAELGGPLNADACRAVALQLHRAPSGDGEGAVPDEVFRRWSVELSDVQTECPGDHLSLVLKACADRGDLDTALALIPELTRPKAVRKVIPLPDGAGSPNLRIADVTIAGRPTVLWQAWNRLIAPALGECAYELCVGLEINLRRAYRLANGQSGRHPGYDRFGGMRSAIEPHDEEVSHDEDVNLLIDWARDSIAELARSRPEAAATLIDGWLASDIPLLQRLAIHAQGRRADLTATEKIRWVIAKLPLYDYRLKHELFAVIRDHQAHADQSAQDALLAAATGTKPEAEWADYEHFNLLTWIVDSAPEFDHARRELEEVELLHPDFGRREHPDLNMVVKTGWGKHNPPMSVGDFHRLLDSDPQEAVREIAELHGTRDTLGQPSWDDGRRLVTELAQTVPSAGVDFLDAVAALEAGAETVGTEVVDSLTSDVIRGWATAALTTQEWGAVLDRLQSAEHLDGSLDEVARLLQAGVADRDHPFPIERLEQAKDLARKVAGVLDAARPARSGNGDGFRWPAIGLNDAQGVLVQFWFAVLELERGAERSGAASMPPEISDQLISLTTGENQGALGAIAMVAGQLRFLHAYDEAWTESNVFPMFDFENRNRAQAAWQGFLVWGRFDDRLLARGLLDMYQQAWRHIDQLGDADSGSRGGPAEDARTRLVDHVADVALYSGSEVRRDWLNDFITAVDDSLREAFARRVGMSWRQALRDAARAGKARPKWDPWLTWARAYWQGRLNSDPRALSPGEVAAMNTWVLCTGDHFAEAVELSLRSAQMGGLDDGLVQDLVRDLAKSDLVRESTNEAARWLTHLLGRAARGEFYSCREAKSVFEAVCLTVAPEVARELAGAALSAGCTDAREWSFS